MERIDEKIRKYLVSEKKDNKKIKLVVDWLYDHEDELSDGFGHYTNDVDKALREIAREIIKAARKSPKAIDDVFDDERITGQISDTLDYGLDFDKATKELYKLLN